MEVISMNNKYEHYYYESTTPNFIQKTFNDFNIYTFESIAYLYIHIQIDSFVNIKHLIYYKIKDKIYEKFKKYINCSTITFCDKPSYLIIYIYDIDIKSLELDFIEFYDYIHKIQIPFKEQVYKLQINTGLYYSKQIKNPILLLDQAYQQYLNTLNNKTFLSILNEELVDPAGLEPATNRL